MFQMLLGSVYALFLWAAPEARAKLVLDAERQEASAAAAAAAAEKAARPKVSAGDMFAEMAAEEKRMCKQYAEKRHRSEEHTSELQSPI